MIAVHALENLGNSDVGITMLRRVLREQLKRIEAGQDPINVVRDKKPITRSKPTPGTLLFSPEQAKLHQGEEI